MKIRRLMTRQIGRDRITAALTIIPFVQLRMQVFLFRVAMLKSSHSIYPWRISVVEMQRGLLIRP